jgi:hypothetical protein
MAEWVAELPVTFYRGREVTGFAQDDTGVDVRTAPHSRRRTSDDLRAALIAVYGMYDRYTPLSTARDSRMPKVFLLRLHMFHLLLGASGRVARRTNPSSEEDAALYRLSTAR